MHAAIMRAIALGALVALCPLPAYAHWLLDETVETSAEQPTDPSGPVEIGLRWRAPGCQPVDLDLHVRARPQGIWLDYSRPFPDAGRHMGDAPEGEAIEMVRLDDVADLRDIEVAVHFVGGTCGGVRGSVRARHDGVVYEVPVDFFEAEAGGGLPSLGDRGFDTAHWEPVPGAALFNFPLPDEPVREPLPDWATDVSVELAEAAPDAQSGILTLGMRWTGETCLPGYRSDLRLYARGDAEAFWSVASAQPIDPGPGAEQAGAATLDLGEVEDLEALQILVNLHEASCRPSTGVVRAQLDGALYEHPFVLTGTQGSQGRFIEDADKATPIWAVIDPAILFDPIIPEEADRP